MRINFISTKLINFSFCLQIRQLTLMLFSFLYIMCGYAQIDERFNKNTLVRNNVNKVSIYTKSKSMSKSKMYLSNEFYINNGLISKDIGYDFKQISAYSYNKSGQLISDKTYNFKKSVLDTLLLCKSSYQYTENKLQVINVDYIDSLGHITSSDKWIRTYKDSLVIQEIWFRQHDTICSFFEYNDKGYKILSYDKEYKTKKNRTEFFYDPTGKLIKQIYYSPYELSYQITEYEYCNEQLIKEIYYPVRFSNKDYSDNSDKNCITVHKIKYNNNGLIKEWSCFSDSGEKMLWISKYKYKKKS